MAARRSLRYVSRRAERTAIELAAQTRTPWQSARQNRAKRVSGWIGTGVMGRWMCQHLMTKGYKATVYNRSKDKADAAARTRGRLGRLAAAGRASKPTWSSPSSAFPRTCAKSSWARGCPGRQQGGHRPGGHDHQRAVAGPARSTKRPRRRGSTASMPRFPAATSAPRTPPCRS